jgi:hypothetical protein
LERDELQDIRHISDGIRESEVPMPALIAGCFMMVPDPTALMIVKFRAVSVAAVMRVMLMVFVWIADQMQVGLRVTVMTVKDDRSPGPLGSGVEEDPAPPAGLSEHRLPAPTPMDPSHR